MDDLVERLSCTGTCRGLSPEEAARLAKCGTVRVVPAGEYLLREGDKGDDMQVILDGVAEIWKRDPTGTEEVRLTEVCAGESIGEMAILRHDQRLASVLAKDECTVFILPRNTFEQLLDAGDMLGFKLGLKMARTMADRLAWVNDQLVQLMQAGKTESPEFAALKDRILREWDY